MKKRLKMITLSLLIMSPSSFAFASGALEDAISSAQIRSEDDQMALRQRVETEKEQRLERWSQRNLGAIEIKNAAPIPSNFDIGIEADLEEEESGEDNSGLNSLHSTVEQESTDINFDDELREVSLAD